MGLARLQARRSGAGAENGVAAGSIAAAVGHVFVGSQIIGLMMARYIVEVEPLASLPAERVVEMIGPTLQRYLMHPLPHKH